jgi:uncharacterized membrane protein
VNKGAVLISGTGLGAAVMYLCDPDRGRRRRALVRDKVIHVARITGAALETTACDTTNRTRGLAMEMRSHLSSGEVSDEVLVQRARARIGRVCSHPHALDVMAHSGHVTLSGPILAREVDHVLKQVSSVRGVTNVENRLEVHKEAGDIPDLQGGVARQGDRFALLRLYWSPAARLLAGATGSALAAYGTRHRDALGVAVGTIGLGLLARALTNTELRRLVGLGAGRRAIDIQKTITIAAPVERVFQIWTNYETFPRIMEHVREVRKTDDQSHWVVAGPLGAPVGWDAVITRLEPNKVLAWRTAPGSPVQHAGIVRFQSNAVGGTRVEIRMTYNPVTGGLGHSVAVLLGADPKHAMDDDLVRLKSLIEHGKTRAHGAAVKLEDVGEDTTRAAAPSEAGPRAR